MLQCFQLFNITVWQYYLRFESSSHEGVYLPFLLYQLCLVSFNRVGRVWFEVSVRNSAGGEF